MTPDTKAEIVRYLQEQGYAFTEDEWSGGFGDVLSAKRDSVDVAVKILREPLDESAIVDAELKALENIRDHTSHANIVTLFAIHQISVDGKRYLATAWELGTKTLADEISETRASGTPLSPTQIVTFLRSIAVAIDYLHKHGTYHCDVKPQNMLFVNEDLRLSDFGMAIMSGLTTVPVVGGTPGFTPPSEKPSPAYDLYGLAASYVWCRTGDQHLRSAGALKKKGMSRAEAAWVARALDADANKRPTDGAVAFLDELNKRVESTVEPRLPLGVVVFVALLILGVALAVGFARQNLRDPTPVAQPEPEPRIKDAPRPQPTHVLSNDGAPTLVLKKAGRSLAYAADSDNHLGVVAVGTGVRVLEEIATDNVFLTFTKVEILDGELKGQVGWVSKRTIRPATRSD